MSRDREATMGVEGLAHMPPEAVSRELFRLEVGCIAHGCFKVTTHWVNPDIADVIRWRRAQMGCLTKWMWEAGCCQRKSREYQRIPGFFMSGEVRIFVQALT